MMNRIKVRLLRFQVEIFFVMVVVNNIFMRVMKMILLGEGFLLEEQGGWVLDFSHGFLWITVMKKKTS